MLAIRSSDTCSLLGGVGAILKQPNLSARTGVKSLWKNAGTMFEATKPVSHDWGNIVVGQCWREFEATKLVSKDWSKFALKRC